MKTTCHFKLICGVAAFSVALIAPQAKASVVWGNALDYSVLIEPGAHSFQLNNSVINGTVGISSGLGSGGVQIASNGFINEATPGQPSTGQLQLVDAAASVSNPGNVQGGVLFNQSAVTTAINTVNSIAATLAGEAGTSLTISGGGQVVNASSGTLDGSGNRVFTLASNAFNNDNGGFSINGTASQYVVLNINNGVSNEALGGPISLTGGITADHVIFNFTGTSGNLGASAGGATIAGVFIAPNMKVNLDNMTLDGWLFGGRTGQDFQLVSGFELDTPTVVTPVPEPASAIFGIALLGVCAATRLRARAAVA